MTAVFDRVINRGFSIGAPLAKAAVDIALHDLLGHALGVPLGVLWGQRRIEQVQLAWVLSGQTPAEVADSVAEGLAAGYRAFKVKIGLHAERTDLAVVAAARAAAPDAPLWVDANQAYAVDSALRWPVNCMGWASPSSNNPCPPTTSAGCAGCGCSVRCRSRWMRACVTPPTWPPSSV